MISLLLEPVRGAAEADRKSFQKNTVSQQKHEEARLFSIILKMLPGSTEKGTAYPNWDKPKFLTS